MFLPVFILYLKKNLTIWHSFIEMFYLQQSRYLRLSMVQESLLRLPKVRSRWFLFIRSEIYILPTHKKYNPKKNHTYLNLVYTICHRVDIYRLQNFWLPLSVIISSKLYPPSTIALRFPHSSSINISLGESTKFPIPSISILSCPSSTVLTLFEDLPLQWKRDFLQQ